MTIVTTNSLPPPVAQMFHEKYLATPQARLVHSAFATPYTMPDRNGTVMRMRRGIRLETSPVPIDPTFSNPPSQLLNVVDIDARIQWYGTWVPITRQVTTVNQDPILNECASRLGQWMRESEDELIRDHLAGTASVINATNGVNGRNVAVIKFSLIDLEVLEQDDRAQAA